MTQRGNNQQDVFFVDGDRRAYLSILAEQGERFGLSIQGYCLMTNHVHLIVTPRDEQSLAKAVGRTHWLYTRYVNRLQGRSGHLWQNRFFSCALGGRHLWRAMAYVERNPVRAKRVRAAWRYPFSSAAAHVGAKCDAAAGLLDLRWWWSKQTPQAWRDVLAVGEEAAAVDEIRHSLRRGRPLGGDRFIAKLETALGRRLRPLPVGRPRKKRMKEDERNGKK